MTTSLKYKSRQTQIGKLYLIADRSLLPLDTMQDTIRSVIDAGVDMVQFRDKTSTSNEKLQTAKLLQTICNEYDIPLIINDDIELATAINADGIHLGRTDMPINTVRRMLGDDMIIGASCYDSIDLAYHACDIGADYVAFGSVFPTTTKDTSIHISLDKLREYSTLISKPVCAIGGITVDNIQKVYECNVDIIAIASGILSYNNPQEATQNIVLQRQA